MITAAFLASSFAAIDDYFKAVSDIMRDGHMPDLSGLDNRVSDLCAAMQQAKPEIQQQFIGKMDDLLRKLDQCEADIKDFQAAHMKDLTHA